MRGHKDGTRNDANRERPAWGAWLLMIGLSPRELEGAFRDLGHQHPGIDPARIMEILMPLYPRRIVRNGRVQSIDIGALAWVRKRQRAEPADREKRAEWRQFGRQIDSLMRGVREAWILGDLRQARILAELEEAARPLRGPWRALVPARGKGSPLDWLPSIGAPLSEYLAQVTCQKPDSIRISRMTARILRAATGNKRITTEAVKARLLRAHIPPLK